MPIFDTKGDCMLESGSLIDGKYRILHKIGEGGTSVVYMAMVERANKIWAIKEIRKDGMQNWETAEQGLLAEAEILKTLHHRHLPSIADMIDTEDSLLIVMDFIEGRTLKSILEDEGIQPPRQVIGWALQLCDVLGYLHGQNIIYRDLKPSNIMLKPDGDVILLDFGAARHYKGTHGEDTTCLGTRGYAAPEQYGGRETDVRTDIYCLGATLYHLLTGHHPGEPPYFMQPIRYWNPALSTGLESVVLRCTRQNPNERYQSVIELRYALEHYRELDESYRKKQQKKLFYFLLPALLSLVFCMAAIIFALLAKAERNRMYENYLEAARGALYQEEEIADYQNAISIDPVRSEAYMGLLTEALAGDGTLSARESETLRAILLSHTDGSRFSNQERFRKENPEGYVQFAYEAGLDYFYRFEETGNKKNARFYFGYVTEHGAELKLEETKVARAGKLYDISSYYASIGVPDAAGDQTVTYEDYWEDLKEISQGNLVEEDNARTALVIYEEMLVQIITNTGLFLAAGVTQEDMRTQIANLETHLRQDFDMADDFSAQDREQVMEMLEQARAAIEAADRKPGD